MKSVFKIKKNHYKKIKKLKNVIFFSNFKKISHKLEKQYFVSLKKITIYQKCVY